MESKVDAGSDKENCNLLNKSIDFHTALKIVGGFGFYQKLLCIFSFVGAIYVSSTYWTQIFLVATPKHWCKLTVHPEYVSSVESCKIYLNRTSILFHDNQHIQSVFNITESEEIPNDRVEIPCPDGWEYDFSVLPQTVAIERNWVCENNWFIYASQTTFWIGCCVGSLIWGLIADRFGRRTALRFLFLLGGLANATTLWLPNDTFFSISRFLVGVSSLPVTLILYIVGAEFASPNKRTIIGAAYVAGYVTGSVGFPWIAASIRDWRIVTLFLCVLACVLLVFTKWLLESASWLLTRRENDKAKEVLAEIAKINSVALPDSFKTCEIVAEISDGDGSRDVPKCLQMTLRLAKSPIYRRRILCLFLASFATNLCCYGLLFHIGKLQFNFYLMYSISGVIEVPSFLYSAILFDRVGRRWSLFTSNFIGGIFSLTLFLVTLGLSSGPVTFAMELVALMFAFLSVNLLIQFGQELFPTAIRGRGVCLQRAIGDLGRCIGSLAVRLSEIDLLLPHVAFGAASMFTGFMVLMLPETAKQKLLMTIEDGEKFGQDQGCCFCPYQDGRKRRGKTLDTVREEELNTTRC